MPSRSDRTVRVALFGLGGVGRAFLELLIEREPPVELVAAADSCGVLQGAIPAGAVLDAKRSGLPPADVDPRELIARVRPDVVVDVTGCDFATGEPSITILLAGLHAGATVVTANKAPLARHWVEIGAAAGGRPIGYAAAAGAALPAVAVARELRRADRIVSIEGVLTGTASFVLDAVAGGAALDAAIARARKTGMAEPDPSLDLGGWDTAAKLVILANTVWDEPIGLDDVAVTGIDERSIAGLEGVAIHLIGAAQRTNGAVVAEVRPRAVGADHPLAGLAPAEKGVVFDGPGIGRVLVSGGRSAPRGAASAVLGDVLRLAEARR